jgi:N-methylhydantoinase A
MIHIGIDTGGTFTDLIAVDSESQRWYTAKVPSVPTNPLEAVIAAIEQSGIALEQTESLILGTTVGTNALLERKGAKLAYLTTAGFEDVPFIQRGNRRHHYDLGWAKPKPFIARRNCIGIDERIDYRGRIETPLQVDRLTELKEALTQSIEEEGLQAVAVNLLFSYLNPSHELALADWLQKHFPGLSVSLSHRVAPVWREFERGLSTIADAYLKPLLSSFINDVGKGLRERGFTGEWALMKSNGGMRLASFVTEEPLQLLLSGLAGGVMGGKTYGMPTSDSLISLDIGGTSSDIAVITEGQQRYAMQYEVEFGLPLALPTIDVTTIGAGGGSIAWIDGGGFLRVGPQSAGAVPGPACYGRGGNEATLTDANLVLGRINPDYFLGGRLPLDRKLAEQVVTGFGKHLQQGIEETAMAIIDVANDNMMNAIRLRTVEVGIDPRDYSLTAFGGAGALQASAVARLLGIKTVIVPPHPGLCSAFGTLTADRRSDRVWTTGFNSADLDLDVLQEQLDKLKQQVVDEIQIQSQSETINVTVKLALRYQGQNYEHEVNLPGSSIGEQDLQQAYKEFNRLHDAFYGYNLSGEVIEIVNMTVTAVAENHIHLPTFNHNNSCSKQGTRPVFFSAEGTRETQVISRYCLPVGATLEGPAILEEVDSTTLLEPGDNLTVDPQGSLVIRLSG